MDLRLQWLYCSKTHSYIDSFITYLTRDDEEGIVHISAKQLPDDSFAIDYDSILHALFHEVHCNPFLCPSDDDFGDRDSDSKKGCLDPEPPPFRTRIYGTPHLDTCPTGQPISNDYFDIFTEEIDPWSPFCCQEEYQLAYWCIKHNLSRAASDELFRNPTMATFTNFTTSHTLFKVLNEMFYAMRIDCWDSGQGCYNHLADPNDVCDDIFPSFVFHNLVDCIEFHIQQRSFLEHMSYSPAKEFNDAEECIYSEVKSRDRLWNEQVC